MNRQTTIYFENGQDKVLAKVLAILTEEGKKNE